MIRDQDDGTIRFAHHTIRQYLLSEDAKKRNETFACSMDEAEHFVGQMCLTYLSFSDFETQIEARKPELKVKQPSFGAGTLISSLLGIPNSLFEMPYRLLGGAASTAAPSIDYIKYLTPASATTDTATVKKLGEKYQLLLYIMEFWMFYTKNFTKNMGQISEKLYNIARHKQLSFEFRPWGPNQHHGRYGCVSCASSGAAELAAKRLPFMSMLHYAAEVGHWSLMEPLISDYCSHESGDDETLVIACRAGHLSIVKKLIQLYKFDLSNEKAMIAAGASGNEKIFAYLLEATPTGLRGHRPLILACANGYEAIAKELLRRGTLANTIDRNLGETALSAAASNGHDQIVQTLVDYGARILTTGKNPLHCAAENGHDVVVRTLLKAKFDYQGSPLDLIDALDQDGDTPLHKASRNGHRDAVEVMLGYFSQFRTLSLAEKRGGPYQQQAIHLAALNGHVRVLALLAEHVSIDALDSNTRTPLMLAAMEGHVLVIQFLIHHKNWNPFAVAVWKDKDGFSARELAIIGGHENAVKAILEVDPGHTAHEMKTILVLAARKGNESVLATVIEVSNNDYGAASTLSILSAAQAIAGHQRQSIAAQRLGFAMERFAQDEQL